MVVEYRLAYNSTCKFQHNVIFNKHENIADKVVSRRHLILRSNVCEDVRLMYWAMSVMVVQPELK